MNSKPKRHLIYALIIASALALPHVVLWGFLEKQSELTTAFGKETTLVIVCGLFIAGGLVVGSITFVALYLRLHPAIVLTVALVVGIAVGLLNLYFGLLWSFIRNPPYY